MIELDNRTSLKIDTDAIDAIAIFLTKKDIELIITDNEEMREINKAHRDIEDRKSVV